MKHPISTLLVSLSCLGSAQAFAQNVSSTLQGDLQARAGASVASAGDLNLDGYDDYMVGSPGENASRGAVRVYSGKYGNLLYTWYGTSPGELFGASLAPAGDIDGDGRPDVIIGAPGAQEQGLTVGAAFVYSGSIGGVLRAFYGSDPGGGLGWSVAGVGDIDGDGFPDLAVGAPFENHDASGAFLLETGAVRLYSGASGALMARIAGTTQGEQCGKSVAPAGDVNGDGTPDLLIGSPEHGAARQGRMRLISGRDKAVLHTWHGGVGAEMGTSMCTVGDIDGDGKPDFLFGLPGTAGNGPESGSAVVVSGASFLGLMYLAGDSGSALGYSVGAPGDVDGDGIPDLLVGAPQARLGLIGEFGKAVVYSGADGTKLFTLFGTTQFGLCGLAVASAGDVNGDGVGDLIVGAPADSSAGFYAGQVRVVLMGGSAGTAYCFGDGSGTACPCGASPSWKRAGCPNSVGGAGKLVANGIARISNDTVQLLATGMPNETALFFQASVMISGGHGMTFDDGLRCVGGSIVRLGVRQNVLGGSAFPYTNQPGLSVQGGVQAGTTRHYQVWYRDPAPGFCTSATSNYTNAFAIIWQP